MSSVTVNLAFVRAADGDINTLAGVSSPVSVLVER